MKKAKTYIDFSKDKIIIFDEEVPVKFSTSGHYCITVGKMNKENENVLVQENIVCFSDDLTNKDRNNKMKYCFEITSSIQSSKCTETHVITERCQCWW